MTPRERSVRAARSLLSDERLLAFLAAVRDHDDVLAVHLAHVDLAGGKSLDESFYTGERAGYLLSAKPLTDSTFDIAFGCRVAPTAGDGGEWRVAFDGDAVSMVEGGLTWVG